MKIAITADAGDLDSDISPVFNVANYFLIVDPDDPVNYEVIHNPHVKQLTGSEIFGAQLVISYDVNALLTGHCTPNAQRIFHAAGIKVIDNIKGKVKPNLPDIKKQLLTEDGTEPMLLK